MEAAAAKGALRRQEERLTRRA